MRKGKVDRNAYSQGWRRNVSGGQFASALRLMLYGLAVAGMLLPPRVLAAPQDGPALPIRRIDAETVTHSVPRPEGPSQLRWVIPPDDQLSNQSPQGVPTTLAAQPLAMQDPNPPPNAQAPPNPATPRGSQGGFDPAVVARGQAAFQSACTACHSAEQATQKRKTQAAWLATVRRMAAKPDADIPAGDHEPIATYLASLGGANGGGTAAAGAEQTWSLNATISTMWRNSNTDDLANPDFLVDAWFGADWQSTGPLRATITACTSCHADVNLSQGFSLELVEASVTLDLKQLCCGHKRCDPSELSADLKAGRFIVPFGAFASMVHPGVYRTVSNPLIFDMGRRVNLPGSTPVLPAPFADEGVDLTVGATLVGNVRATLDTYATNGLQGDRDMSFPDSREYQDNNSSPGIGNRLTLGNQKMRFGGSCMFGNMQDEGDETASYELWGCDFTFRSGDILRLYAEWAWRNNDTRRFAGDHQGEGYVLEGELRIWKKPRIGLLARYDTLDNRDPFLFRDSSFDRFTWGVNIALFANSTLIINHEHWSITHHDDVDVFGLRWFASF